MKILYFTATGNSLYVAKKLGGQLLSIPQLVKAKVDEIEDEAVGVVCPVYCGELPRMVREFLMKAKIGTNYFFFVLTYGMNETTARFHAGALCDEIGLRLDYADAVLMVDNYLPGFEMREQMDSVAQKDIEGQLARITDHIRQRKKQTVTVSPLKKAEMALIHRAMGKRILTPDAAKHYIKTQASAGKTVFYDIYTDAEKQADPDKKDTGLFFFRGTPGAKCAIVNAGGGFAYVGAMHDSFPHALELSKMGYNAFALIYRPGAQTACEDLARAIEFIHEHAEELQIDPAGYSLWGGSAGGRMAAWLGSYSTESFGEKAYPRPAAVIVNYTGLSEVTGNEPPTYSAVGTGDGIASYRTMQNRINAIKANGTDAMIEVFQGLPHGFGLGTGTVAEGWINNAVSFWERNMNE